MRGKSTFAIILVLLNLLGLVLLTPKLSEGAYVTEWFIIILLMGLTVLLFYALDNRLNWSWALGTVFFAMSLLNMVYLYFRITSYLLILITIASAMGFIISVTAIRKPRKMEIFHVKEEPEVIVEEIKPKEVVTKKKAKTRVTKKTVKKKTTRKKK